jgi:hypothetical protein
VCGSIEEGMSAGGTIEYVQVIGEVRRVDLGEEAGGDNERADQCTGWFNGLR